MVKRKLTLGGYLDRDNVAVTIDDPISMTGQAIEVKFGELDLSELPECWRELAQMHFSLKAGRSQWRVAFASGVPATMGSKKGFAIKGKEGTKRAGKWFANVVDANDPKLNTFQNNLRASVRKCVQFGEIWTGPVETGCVALMSRPKCHFRSGKFSHLLKPDAPEFPTQKPDADKVLRAVWDCGTGIWFVDDSQCVSATLQKLYIPGISYDPGVIVYARALPAEESGRVF